MWSRRRFYLLNTLAPGALAGAGRLSAVSDPDLAPLNTDGATLPIRSEHRQIEEIRLDTGCSSNRTKRNVKKKKKNTSNLLSFSSPSQLLTTVVHV